MGIPDTVGRWNYVLNIDSRNFPTHLPEPCAVCLIQDGEWKIIYSLENMISSQENTYKQKFSPRWPKIAHSTSLKLTSPIGCPELPSKFLVVIL